MSLHEYQRSKAIADEPFYALIMAAIRAADTFNAERLREAFPDTHEEMLLRYNAPQGLLPGESNDGWTRREDGALLNPEGEVVRHG